MAEFTKKDGVLLFFFFSLLLMEFAFRKGLFQEIQLRDYLLSVIFILGISVFLFFMIGFFRGKAGFSVSFLLIVLCSLLYQSQFIYYKFFKTFYTVYSAGNGAQAAEFWRDIGNLARENAFWLAVFLAPPLLFLPLGRFFTFQKQDKLNRISLIACFAFSQMAGIGTLMASGKEINSAYDLYFRSSMPLLSVERLGLLTTMRIDMQRQLFGWEPKLSATVKKPPEGSGIWPPPKNSSGEQDEMGYNVMDIDFTQLAAKEKNLDLKDMYSYFSSIEPTRKNPYTGKFKGYNLIFITAESFSPYAVNKEITPTLYKLVHEGYNFTNFYNPVWGVSTSDGEYVACTGLIPKSGVWSFRESGRNYLPFVLGNQLKKLGYDTRAYHNHTYTYYGRDISHPNMGYEYKALGLGLEVKKTWPESDLEMIEKTVPDYIGNQPFHTYYMTVSGHMQYSFTGNYIAWKNRKLVEGLQLSTQAKAYLATQIELDRALEELLERLEENGAADRTLIALGADHYPYGLDAETIDELAGHKVEKTFELYKSPFILYAKGMRPEKIDVPASSLDIIPTLSNLLGLEYDSRLLMGRDIFSDSDPLVMFVDKSFITDKGRYNSVTGEFSPADGSAVDKKYIQAVSSMVQAKFHYSAKMLDTDFYGKLFGK
ncbi:LTA synthase family protein [Neobacillus piezotolerans]|uniref:LTA synthase family protein n=1 Tax=Neobacillus piezotolerans TaxID=2259171 RepID=A0A3D8GN94_9BACI|nr:LTA synthase family protein [Neobacillus piezotolerans]RDU35964.1 LTA synthase family protein [Neobacillus piezotolerans]